jgi:hypothetical protein
MKYFVSFMFLSFFLSCSERNQTGDESDKIDQLENVESKSETENTKIPESKAESFGIIGTWTIPSSFGGGELRIEHHLGKYYKNEELSDGTVNISEMIITEDGGLKIFRIKDGPSNETWVITESGTLEARGKDGLIYSTEPI